MTIARGAAIGALVLVTLFVLYLLVAGGGSEQYRLIFQNAGQLVRGGEVQIGGRRVGAVEDILLTDDNQAEVVISVDEPYAPLHEGTTATVRLLSLSGVANRYVSLSPGPNSEPELPSGATLGVEATTSVVDLDQVFNTLDARTRRGLTDFIQGSAAQYDGRSEQIQESSRWFGPALNATTQVMRELGRDTRMLEQTLVSGSSVTGAIAARGDELSSLIGNLSTMMGAIARENAGLAQTLDELPGALREASSTFVDLRTTLDALDPLVAESKVATKDLPRFFRALRPLIVEGEPALEDLATLISQPGPANDATDALRQTPRLQRIASPAFRRAVRTMREGQPVIDFLRPYAPEFVGWFRDFGQSSANYDANGHYLRAAPVFGAFDFQQNADGSSELVPVPPSQRMGQARSGYLRRCPGAASQPRPDGSNPFAPAGFDCDPGEVPPGP